MSLEILKSTSSEVSCPCWDSHEGRDEKINNDVGDSGIIDEVSIVESKLESSKKQKKLSH